MEIDRVFDQLQGLKQPPIARWHPRESLDIDLRIAGDGRWFHQGTPIERTPLVKLFGSVLRLESDGYYLITPRLKYPVRVADAPFQAVEVERRGAGRAQRLVFRTNVDDVVLADQHHPIRLKTAPSSKQRVPYIEVRDGLQAKICRAVYYELAQLLEPADSALDLAEAKCGVGDKSGGANPSKILGVYSAGHFFPFGHSA